MLNQTQDYNALLPPENPEYPWKPDWQPLCYYCAQPIHLTTPIAMYRQRVSFHWEHLDGTYNCDPAKIRPTAEIDDPRCGCCHVQTPPHNGACSAVGKPVHHATTMSAKEDELIRLFGWKSPCGAVVEPS